LEFRLRIVKLYLEEGYSPKLLVEQFEISTHSIQRWVKAFRLHGAAGLEPKRPVSRKSRVAEEVRQQAVGVKAAHPEYGPRRKRAAAYGWIHDLAAELSTRAGKSVITPTAWRIAARQWLVKNGLIRIQKAGEVSPNFCRKSDHN
jgi:transposase-like protein